MRKLRTLSGKEVIALLAKFGFGTIGQKGSHVKLRRVLNGRKQTLLIPDHKELDRGTLKAIYTQTLRYISEAELERHFYTG